MINDNHFPSSEPLTCKDVKDLLYLYSCAELSPAEMGLVEAHLKDCSSCTVALEEHKKLRGVLRGAFSTRKLYYYSKNN